MDIKAFGGEFKLIRAMTAGFENRHGAVITVGDDGAVGPTGEGDYRVFTTDMLLEGSHFDLRWSRPGDLGTKLVEVNVSDVAAMGAGPEFLLLSIGLPGATEAEFVLALYDAIRERCHCHGITLLGGDTTRSRELVLSATLTGRTKQPVYRSTARAGDLIAVTGDVGAAAAAIMSFRRGLTPVARVAKRHLAPRARTDVAAAVAHCASAMLDVSDGVASEVRHLCQASHLGAVVEAGALPILPDTRATALAAGVSALECGLSGGEDFELLFALPPARLVELRQAKVDFTLIGEFLPPDDGVSLRDPAGHLVALPGGFDHFAPD
jgi:thiamine-monophosphate kinase